MKPLGLKEQTTAITLPPVVDLADNIEESGSDLLAIAISLDDRGLSTQAEIVFGQAIADGQPAALAEFARFMRRSGRPARALELYFQVLADPDLLASNHGEAVRLRARALASIGLIERLQGQMVESEKHLLEAARTVSEHVDELPEVYAYVADNLGHTLARLGRVADAIEQFEAVMALRRRLDMTSDVPQSVVNLAHAYMAANDYVRAAELFSDALELTDGLAGRLVRANALCGHADARLRRGNLEGIDASLAEALALNEEVGNSNGIGIARGLMARLAIAQGDLGRAAAEIDACAVQSEKSENVSGRGTVLWLRAEVALATGDVLYAIDLLDGAEGLAGRASNVLLMRDVSDARSRAAKANAGSVDLQD